jgi:hypothetical protein
MNICRITLGVLLYTGMSVSAMHKDVPVAAPQPLEIAQAQLNGYKQSLQRMQEQVARGEIVLPVQALEFIDERIEETQRLLNTLVQNKHIIDDPAIDKGTQDKKAAFEALQSKLAKEEQRVLASFPNEYRDIAQMISCAELMVSARIAKAHLNNMTPEEFQRCTADVEQKKPE